MREISVRGRSLDSHLTIALLAAFAFAAGCARGPDPAKRNAEILLEQWAKIEKLPVRERPTAAEVHKQLGEWPTSLVAS